MAGEKQKRKGNGSGTRKQEEAPVTPVPANKPRTRPGRSAKARKQRKRAWTSTHNRRNKLMAAHLSSKYLEDKKTRYPRSLPVRKGDTVLVIRGKDKGHEGKVTEVDHRSLRVLVEGVTVAKSDGTEVGKPIHPSNVIITKLDMTDPWRKRLIERSGRE